MPTMTMYTTADIARTCIIAFPVMATHCTIQRKFLFENVALVSLVAKKHRFVVLEWDLQLERLTLLTNSSQERSVCLVKHCLGYWMSFTMNCSGIPRRLDAQAVA